MGIAPGFALVIQLTHQLKDLEIDSNALAVRYYAGRDPSKTAEQIASILAKRNDGGPFWWPKLCEAVQKKYCSRTPQHDLLVRSTGHTRSLLLSVYINGLRCRYNGEPVSLEIALARQRERNGSAVSETAVSETPSGADNLVWREAVEILRVFVANCKLHDTGLFGAGGGS